MGLKLVQKARIRLTSTDYRKLDEICREIKDIAENLDLTNAYIALKHVLKRSSLRKDECSICLLYTSPSPRDRG